MLTARQKELLTFIVEHDNSFPQEKDGFPKEERRTILKELVRLGVFDKNKPSFTNRGISHLVVDCNIPFLKLLEVYPNNYESKKAELEKIGRLLDNNKDWVNIYYYHIQMQYLEWDVFDENHNWKPVLDKEHAKYGISIIEKLLEDGRIPIQKVLEMYQIPPTFFANLGIPDSDVKRMISTVRGFL